MTGRPREITRDAVDAAAEGIRRGLTYRMAVKSLGYDWSGFRRAVERDEAFSAIIARARRDCVQVHVDKVAASEDWRSSAWYLARVEPLDFSEPAAIRTAIMEMLESEAGRAEFVVLMERHGIVIPESDEALLQAVIDRIGADDAIKAIQSTKESKALPPVRSKAPTGPDETI